MEVTCFSFQSGLSDYLEGVLPASRHSKMAEHLSSCPHCQKLSRRFETTLLLLESAELPEVESSIWMRACASFESKWRMSRPLWGRVPMWAAVSGIAGALIIFLSVGIYFQFLSQDRFFQLQEENFVRYYPIVHGANELIEEHAYWLLSRSHSQGSVWEEGGMAAEEFEKIFQSDKSAPTP